MKIIKTTNNELVIIHSNRLKEWGMALAIASIGILPLIFHTSDELFIKVSKVVFLITFILVGLLGVHEEYHIEFNVKKRKMTMEYKNIIEVLLRQHGREMVLDLDQIRGAIVQQVKEGKKTLYKLAIDYSDGLKIGVTETYYYFPDTVTLIKTDINNWLKQTGLSGTKNNGATNDDDDDENTSSEEEEEEEDTSQLIKKRKTNKVK